VDFAHTVGGVKVGGHGRYYAAVTVVCLMLCAVVARMVSLSYANRDRYEEALRKTRRAISTANARRGMILDRNLDVLAFDEARIVLGVDPYAADAEKDMEKIRTLADFLTVDVDFILKKFARGRRIVDGVARRIRWVPICEIRGESVHSAVMAIGVRGIYGLRMHRRAYPLGRKAAHITGFVDGDGTPVCGVERHMDFHLRGRDGYVESERDGRALELVQYRTKELPRKDGASVVLTVDRNIQEIVHDEVANLMEKFSPLAVSAIASEVETGNILALVNYPDYDPNDYGKFPIESMKNLAVCNAYELASVFKIIPFSFGLEYDLVDEDTVFDCTIPTAINRGQKVPLPRDDQPVDRLTFVEAIRRSSNRVAAQIAILLGEERFYAGIRAYGIGDKPGYGFDGESKGILPPLEKWDPWTITRMPMGHGVGVAPLQIHCAMAAIANDGILLRPNLCRSVLDGGDAIFSTQPIVRRRVVSQRTAIRMRRVLHNPRNGALANGVEFGGKTGTGQKIIDGAYSTEHHMSTYSGFFPVSVPKVCLTVVVDDARMPDGRTAYGIKVALPAFKAMALRIAQYLDLRSTP
jgi:cell division protein FtsI/penicillin-binding protein 2